MAGVILQDRNTSANLAQVVSKFNSPNQNMFSDAATYPGASLFGLRRIKQQNIPTQD